MEHNERKVSRIAELVGEEPDNIRIFLTPYTGTILTREDAQAVYKTTRHKDSDQACTVFIRWLELCETDEDAQEAYKVAPSMGLFRKVHHSELQNLALRRRIQLCDTVKKAVAAYFEAWNQDTFTKEQSLAVRRIYDLLE